MVTCSLKKAKSTLGRTTEAGCVEGLTGGRMGSTVEAAVVTTSFGCNRPYARDFSRFLTFFGADLA